AATNDGFLCAQRRPRGIIEGSAATEQCSANSGPTQQHRPLRNESRMHPDTAADFDVVGDDRIGSRILENSADAVEVAADLRVVDPHDALGAKPLAHEDLGLNLRARIRQGDARWISE